jgi:hypothetical protein
MLSSPGEQIEANALDFCDAIIPPKPKSAWSAQFDTDQVFRLIDSILPFEACLYHQVLPLSLEGSRLKLGMVSLDDGAAIDYVRRILAYMNCSLVPQTLSTEIHHAALTAYLNYTGSREQSSPRSISSGAAPEVAQPTPPTLVSPVLEEPVAPPANHRSERGDRNGHDRNNAETFLVHRPAELMQTTANPQPLAVVPPDAAPDAAPDETQVLDYPVEAPPVLSTPAAMKPTMILEVAPPPEHPPTLPVLASLPELEVTARHLSDPVELLATLSPDRLLHELFGRILIGGIGRLYFERQAHHGRILWSQNGVVQSVLGDLPIATVQGVIDELKRLTQLPIEPVQTPTQVEIERLYQKHRLLLRLRVMPHAHGEEATLQVLRGSALRFYQQQQLTTLSRDALALAQELQQKLIEFRARARSQEALTPEQLSVVPTLDEVLKSVAQQFEGLRTLQNGIPTGTAENSPGMRIN